MTSKSKLTLASLLRGGPLPCGSALAAERVDALLEVLPAAARALFAAHPALRPFMEGVADGSPFLWRLVEADPARLARLLSCEPRQAFAELVEAVGAAGAAGERGVVMRELRKAKQESALLIAFADLGGVWDAVEVTRALSDFADAAVRAALSFLLREADAQGKIALPDREDPQAGCGLVVLALGKHGAQELNYSSDVDLVIFFDPETSVAPEGTAQAVYVRIVKALVMLLQERTEDGYVLRVDLRLRPDPGSTQVAISLPSAYAYYETLGQNWERAAFIKARPVAGDVALGAAFLQELTPFIWRKYFDYAAIADVHAMKRQIHAVRGHDEVVVLGHDVKLGRGGIREIEFFVQTQQLIFGGRRPQLRGSRTLEMLEALHNDQWVSKEAVETLTEAYKFLRGVEHRIQMVADEQTQRLPAEPAALEAFARFSGYPTTQDFTAAVTQRFHAVAAEYARLFEHAPGLDSKAGSLVFTGSEDDPETLKTLEALGFRDPSAAAELVRGWHFGRRPAVRTPRAREVLTELVPGLLDAFSGSGDPDAALAAFDAMLARMPAAVELFAILRSNDAVRELFGDLLGGAPQLVSIVTRRPHVLDAAIGAQRVEGGETDHEYAERLDVMLAGEGEFEVFLDRARYIAQDEMFLIGVRMFSGLVEPMRAARTYSLLAEAVVRATLEEVRREFERDHGRVEGGACAVIALGKLGSREMTATSDLDLMMIYDFDDARAESTGQRSLHATQYYTRLTQRLVSALTAPTRAGKLYEVDMRLRPSGHKGPVATQLSAFKDYQASEAETWEKMSLTRARAIAGDAVLGARVAEVIEATIRACAEKDTAKEVRDMRALIAQEKGEDDRWNLKLAAGGMLDIEFLAQYLVLRHGRDDARLRGPGTEDVLRAAAQTSRISPEDAETLLSAHRRFSDATQLTRVCVEGRFDPDIAPLGVKRRITAALDAPGMSALIADLDQRRTAVRAIFRRVLRA
jgi:glutamate-ammonia-ligase adenylyltransferase